MSEALASEESKFGTLPVVRVFDPGLPPSDAWARRDGALRGKIVVTSFRADPETILSGEDDSSLVHFFQTAPRGQTVYWSFDHEPEADVLAGRYTAEAFRAAWRHIDALADGVHNPRLRATLILTGFTADPASGRDWRTYYPGAASVDVLAWDPYNQVSGTPASYRSPEAVFGPVITISREAGKPFGIAEMGSARSATDSTGSGRAVWLKASATYLRESGALFVTYFDSTRDGDFLLDDPPSVEAWREVVADSTHP